MNNQKKNQQQKASEENNQKVKEEEQSKKNQQQKKAPPTKNTANNLLRNSKSIKANSPSTLTSSNSFRSSVGSPSLRKEKEYVIEKSPTLAETLKQEKERLIIVNQEYEHKLQDLTQALVEKAEHAVELARQAKRDEVTIRELSRTVSDLEKENVLFTKELEAKAGVEEELTRRIKTVTRSLGLLAKENVELKKRVPPELRSTLLGGDKEDEVSIELLKAKVRDLETKVKHSQNGLIKVQQRNISYKQSNNAYELKIQNVQKNMRDNLRKEAARRKATEFEVKRLAQRLEDLNEIAQSISKNDENFLH